jgi:hypothetical protein
LGAQGGALVGVGDRDVTAAAMRVAGRHEIVTDP